MTATMRPTTWPASATSSPDTSPAIGTTATTDRGPVLGDRGGHHTGGASVSGGYALEGHTHETPALPRWVRYLAAVVLGVGLVSIGGLLVDWRQDSRLDNLGDYINSRTDVRDAERAEDLERTRLLICDLLVNLRPPGSPPPGAGTVAAVDRLSCPVAGSRSYDALGD